MNEMHGYMNDTRSQFENMRKQLKEQQEENIRLKQDRESLEGHLEEMDEKNEQLKSDLDALKSSKDAQSLTIDETASLIRELRDKLLESQSEVTRLKRRLERTDQTKDENEDELAEVLNDRENLQIQYDHLVAKLATMELELDEIRNDREIETAKNLKGQEIMTQQEAEIEILRSQVRKSLTNLLKIGFFYFFLNFDKIFFKG